MPDTIRTKSELLGFFADNAAGAISPQNLRDFVVSNQVQTAQVETTSGQTIADLTDVFVAAPGASDVFLPLTSGYGDRFLGIINASGSDLIVNVSGGDTVDGGSSITVGDNQFALLGFAVPTEWFTLINTTPVSTTSQFAQASFVDSSAVTNIIGTVFVDVNDNLVNDFESIDFTVSANLITYTGSKAKLFAIDVSVSAAKVGGSMEAYTYGIARNNVVSEPNIGASLSNASFGTTSLMQLITLNPNDTIKLQVRGDTTSDDLIVADLVLRLTEVT